MFENNPNTPEGWLYIGDDKVRYALAVSYTHLRAHET